MNIGDLCRCTSSGNGHDMIYRVIRVIDNDSHWGKEVEIIPAYQFFGEVNHKRKRTVLVSNCTKIDIVAVGVQYMKLGNFLRQESMKYAEEQADDEQKGATTRVPARNAGGLADSDQDDCGLCADVSARE